MLLNEERSISASRTISRRRSNSDNSSAKSTNLRSQNVDLSLSNVPRWHHSATSEKAGPNRILPKSRTLQDPICVRPGTVLNN